MKKLPRNAELSGVRNSCEMYRTYIFFDSIRAYCNVENEIRTFRLEITVSKRMI